VSGATKIASQVVIVQPYDRRRRAVTEPGAFQFDAGGWLPGAASEARNATDEPELVIFVETDPEPWVKGEDAA
jgi:hypothetical protein